MPTKAEETAEQYVLAQVRAGKVVDLTNKPDKQLRGCFIRDLVTEKLIVSQIGIAIDGAIVNGPIDLRNSEIPYHVELTHFTFLGDVNLKRSHFLKGLSFAGSCFGSSPFGPGRVDAESAKVDFDFTIDDCTFNNCFTFFKSMRIGVDWSLRRTKFLGVADFTGANIDGNFFADRESETDPRTHFQGEADFESMRVGLNCGLSSVTFDEFVNFGGANFNGFSIVGSWFNGDVNFRSTKINNFYLFCAHDPCGGEADTQFNKRLTIEDMEFQFMSPEEWDKVKRFAEKSNDQPNQANYSAQFYASLESQFRRHGLPDQADEVYINSMRKQRKHLSWYRKAGSYFLDGFIGYGRHLERLLYLWSPLFLLLGCIVFWREANMETKRPDDYQRYKGKYRRIWYTIDLFLPIIRLGEAEIWTPRQRWRIWYKYCHVIVGNLFVPIGLAAWTGFIK